MGYTVSLSKGTTAAFLGLVYIIAFILTPYWMLFTSMGAVVSYFVLTIALGILWLFLSVDSLKIEFRSRDVGLLLLLLAAIVILNFRALNSVIPFRGDEALHIERTLELMRRIPLPEAVILIVLFGLFVFAGIRQPRWLTFSGILLVTSIVLFFLRNDSLHDVIRTPQFFVRYPFINYWFYVLFPKLADVIGSPYHEVLFRLIPVLAMTGVAWVFLKKIDTSNLLLAISWGVAAAALPIVFYYSSILYIEPPAVFLMTIVCLNARKLLYEDSRQILKTPAWYALILIGYVKETTIPFLVCFLAIRWIVQLRLWLKEPIAQKTWTLRLTREFGILFAVLAPVVFYVYFRATLTSTRSFIPHLSNLFDATIYPVIARSFVEQFGLFVLIFLFGCILLLKDRDFWFLICSISLILATLVFHILDDKAYVGYSRFNLFLLPPILAVSLRFINWTIQKRQVIGIALVFTTIVVNLLVSPVHLDGVKTANWGNYLADTSEHYYPYQDALTWLKENYPNQRVLFTGLDFYYPLQFYWNKLDWKPARDGIPTESTGDERSAISDLLRYAQRKNFSVVVYRVLNEDLVVPAETDGFRVQIIQNSAHRLIVFHKP